MIVIIKILEQMGFLGEVGLPIGQKLVEVLAYDVPVGGIREKL